MSFSQKIYYNDKAVIITTDREEYVSNHPNAEDYDVYTGATLRSFTHALQDLDRPGIRGVVIEDASQDALQEQLHIMYAPIHAGGGVTYNEQGEILMIYRRGKWDLPKGKLDEGESIDECALREVSEETGLQNLVLQEKICDTFHIYAQGNEQLLKQTAWYRMKGSAEGKLRPQKEENILEARWVAEKDLAPLLQKSYEAIREVLRAAGVHWDTAAAKS